MGDNYYGLAFLYSDMKRYADAIRAWEQVIELHDRNPVGMPAQTSEMGKEWPRREIAKLQAALRGGS